MKRTMPLLLTLALVIHARADEKAETQAKMLVDSATRIVAIMKTIKDKQGAEKVREDLEKALAAVKKTEDEFKKLPEEELAKLKETYGPKFDALRVEFKKEGERLQKLPEVMAILADLAPFRQAREAKVNLTRAMLKSLDKAVTQFKLTTGDYPKSLEALAASPGDGIKPFIPKEALIDSWGRPFQYDLKGPMNKGEKPDIWSPGPPDLKNALIGNWPPRK